MTRPRVVVTGATGGIGAACVHRFVAGGWDVVAVGRSAESLTRLAESFPPDRRPLSVALDVGDGDAVAEALGGLGPVQAVVAAAGVCRQARLADADGPAVWRDVLRTNLDGVYHTLRALAPDMPNGGRVVAVSSGLGKLGRPGYGAYAASKHAVLGLVKCVARELAPRAITVNAVCPGWVDTEMARADLDYTAETGACPASELRASAEAAIPLGRFVTADEVAALIGWLVSEEAAAITGQAFNISGGELPA